MRVNINYLNFLLFFASCSRTWGWEWTEVDKVIEDFLQQTGAPGLVLGYVNGSQIMSKGYRYSDIDARRFADNNTRVFVASLSKSFTAIVVCRVLQSKYPHLGEAVLDTPIIELVPTYNFTLIDQYRTEKATFRDLLAHRTCLNLNSPVGGGRSKVWKSREDFIYRMRYLPEQCDFRSSFVYSGKAMPILAGDIAGHIAGVPFDNLVKNLFRDIGMDNSVTAIETEDYDKMDNLSKGYYVNYENELDTIPIHVVANLIEGPAASGVISTSTDMARFIRFHLSKGNVSGVQIVPKEIMDWVHQVSQVNIFDGTAMTEGFDLGYALGLEWGVLGPYSRLGHNGNMPPFTSRMYFYPELGVGLYTTTNGLANWRSHVPLHTKLMGIIAGLPVSDANVNYKLQLAEDNTVQIQELMGRQEGHNNQSMPTVDLDLDVDHSNLVGTYGHPYEGDVIITTSDTDGVNLKLSYGFFGKGTLTPIPNEPLVYNTTWDREMVSILVINSAANLLTDVKWDFGTPGVLICIFPNGRMEYKKDATIDTFPTIPWRQDTDNTSCPASGSNVSNAFSYILLGFVQYMALSIMSMDGYIMLSHFMQSI